MITLTLHCPERSGIVLEISDFLFKKGCNIVALEQHSEDDRFFIRIQWNDNNSWKNEAHFSKDFKLVNNKLGGLFDIYFFRKEQTLGLFVSKEPHVLLEILNKVELDEFGKTKIPFIISNYDNDIIAKRYNIPFYYIPTKNNPLYEEQQLEIIQQYNPSFIGLARYMKILTAHFIDYAHCPIINIHHSFLPSFVGATPYEMAYERGVKLIGATSHFVIPALDQGPIIEQDVTRIKSGYSVEKLKKLGRDTEKKVFSYALKKVLEHKVILYKNRTIIFE